MFTVTVEQDPDTELTPEEVRQALSLLLLPRINSLWEEWVQSGLLTLEEDEGGRRWTVNDAQEEADEEDGEGSE